MITLLKKSSFKKSPWKNGLGQTSQIDIFPSGSNIVDDSFLWRISTATITQNNQFSLFPDCDRLLVVWKGAGLNINGQNLAPHTPLLFSGEKDIFCELQSPDQVVDLGIIYKKTLMNVDLDIMRLPPKSSITIKTGINFFFLASKDICFIENNELESGDCLKVETIQNISFSTKSSQEILLYNFFIQYK
ncbi:MAG: HutD family protein [Bacteriovorax sp.]|nr:HutD family protein [Bacteriovorax sp.]